MIPELVTKIKESDMRCNSCSHLLPTAKQKNFLNSFYDLLAHTTEQNKETKHRKNNKFFLPKKFHV